ncbi:AraC family transcriptional regulator [Vibrio mexicanus]|uniref:AraC family transcriptional regulator n=1 Tax=Vibrio mexicanus TaxID=1004326 RepID=UPI00063C731D|nr:AraC family transcriptional regulator [Vibrio mexicanus]
MEEQFSYLKSPHTAGLSAFSAKMKEFSYVKHAHEEYSIGVTCSGRQDFFSDGKYHKSNAGNIIFFNPEQVHDGCAGAGEEMQYRMLYIPEPVITDLAQTITGNQTHPIRLTSSLFQDRLLREQVFNLAGLINRAEPSSSLEEEHLLMAVAHSIVRLGGKSVEPLSTRHRKETLLERAKEFIHYNLHRKMTIDEIASAASMSKYHFIRLFNEQFGMTPHQYVLSSRINRCKQALELGDKAVNIATQFGFSDLSHLNRNFKSTFGITPNQYQQQLFE